MSVDLTSKKVFILNKVPQSGIDYMKEQGLVVDVWDKDETIDKNILLQRVKGAHALYCFLSHKIDKELLDATGDQLEVIGTYSVGHEHIDLEECKRRGIKVGYTPDVLSAATAELCISLMLAVARRICEGMDAVKSGGWGAWSAMWMWGRSIRGSTVGIVGMGRIGVIVAEGVKGLGAAKILYTNRSSSLSPEFDYLKAERVDIDQLVTSSDFVLALCTLNDSTRGMFDKGVFKQMKKSAFFINCSRGDVVKQDDLCWALENGEIGGAGLDVTMPEPLPPTHALLTYPNVVITPHIGSAVVETRVNMSLLTGRNIVAGLRKETMPASIF